MKISQEKTDPFMLKMLITLSVLCMYFNARCQSNLKVDSLRSSSFIKSNDFISNRKYQSKSIPNNGIEYFNLSYEQLTRKIYLPGPGYFRKPFLSVPYYLYSTPFNDLKKSIN